MRGVHGDDQTADRPENAILDAADDPDPAILDSVGGGRGDEQMNEADRAGISGVDSEDEADRKCGLDRAGDIHPDCRRLETGGHEEIQRRRYRDLADDMRDEERAADDAQD